MADNGLSLIPDGVDDLHALFVGDILATGYWAAKIAEIERGSTVAIIGAGPTGICALQCAKLRSPSQILVCEKDAARREFVRAHYPYARVFAPREFEAACKALERGGADSVLEVAGGDDTFELAWKCARPNAVVVIVAMYGKCDCDEILRLIAEGKLDTSPLVTHTFPLSRADEAYALFEDRRDGVIKVALKP